MVSRLQLRRTAGLILIALSCLSLAQGETTVAVAPVSQTLTRGGQFTIDVNIANVANLQAAHVLCVFDALLVRFESVDAGTFFPVGSIFQHAPAGGGGEGRVLVDQGIVGGTPLSGSGTLFTLHFTGLSAGISSLTLTDSLRDPSNNDITATVTSGSVTVNNPLPTLSSISPTTKTSDDATFTLTVDGTNFVPTSVVRWNGSDRVTTYVNATEITASIPASDLTTVGVYPVTVFNPSPGGGTSSSADFTVTYGVLHHFAIATITSPQTAGTPFNIDITAQDAHNNTVASFVGTVNLATTAGTITPTVSGSFVGGLRTEAVTVTQSGTGKTITATNSAGSETGTSGGFTVNAGSLHHFVFAAISTPQKTEVPFSVTVTAQDANNNTVTGFTGTVDLTTNAGTISPTVTGAFVAGQLAQGMAVTVVGTGRTITATRTSGSETGTSNAFDVLLGPFTAMTTVLPDLYNGGAAWGDYDGDGDLDLALMGQTVNDEPRVTRIYRNDNGTFVDINAPLALEAEGTFSWGDYDRDGDLDLLTTGQLSGGVRGTRVYNNSGGAFSAVSTGMQNVGSGAARWGDYDNDGALDVVLNGSNGSIGDARLYRNTNGAFAQISVPFIGTIGSSVEWADFDNDGDLDLMEGGWTGSAAITKLFRNTNGTFDEVTTGIPGLSGSMLAWGDYDSDGDLDLLITGGTGTGSFAKIYRNDNGTFVDINASLTPVAGTAGGWVGGWGDYDNDGDLDVLISGTTGSQYVTKIFQNTNGVFTEVPTGLTGILGYVAWGDYDNDGDLDIVVTGYLTGKTQPFTKLYRNNTTTTNTAPSAPTVLTSSVSGTTANLSWNAGSDAQTPASGLTYDIRVGTTPGGCNIVSPMANSSTGYRKIPAFGMVNGNKSWNIKGLAPGQYYWSVQSIDNSFAGSAFAAEQSFIVIGPVTHFVIGAIASPQLKDTPFNMGPITAQDVNNRTATSFAGTVDITTTGSLSAGSGTTATFTDGVLASHNVTFSATGTGITLTAKTTGSTETGTSNAFNVVPANYAISSSAGAHGTISPTPSATVAYNASQGFTMEPASGYHVGRLLVDGTDVNPSTTYTFSNVIADHSIQASFAQDSYTISAVGTQTVDANGDGTSDMTLSFTTLPSGGGSVNIFVYREAPAGAPAPPAGSIPCYVQITSTIPAHTFAVTVKLDMSTVTGFGSGSYVSYYNTTTSSWVLIPGTYTASDLAFSGHPSYQYSTDHFSNFAFLTLADPPKNLIAGSSASSTAPVTVYPNTTWGPATSYEGVPPTDWSWTGTEPVSIALVPQAGSIFGSCDITLEWNSSVLTYSSVDFGSAGSPNGLFGTGQSYTPTASVDYTPGQNRLIIHGARGDASDFTTTSGDYIAKVQFTVTKPGFSAVDIIGAHFEKRTPASDVYMMPLRAEVRGYLCDVASSGQPNTGDGKINFDDLSPWSLSYWSGTSGFSGGMTHYQKKYDFGPTETKYVTSLPTYDSKIDFEDLVLFSISYGLTADHRLMKVSTETEKPVQVALGTARKSGAETLIPVKLEGSVADLRAVSMELTGKFGSVVGVVPGDLLNGYTTPVPIMWRSNEGRAYVDLAIMGLAAPALDREGELVVLRFVGNTTVNLVNVLARTSTNTPVTLEIQRSAAGLTPTVFNLTQNYPNPFNPSTTIEYDVPSPSRVTIRVFNILGEQVATLVDDMQDAGSHSISWNARNDSQNGVGSGVYFCFMKAGDFSKVVKMVVLK